MSIWDSEYFVCPNFWISSRSLLGFPKSSSMVARARLSSWMDLLQHVPSKKTVFQRGPTPAVTGTEHLNLAVPRLPSTACSVSVVLQLLSSNCKRLQLSITKLLCNCRCTLLRSSSPAALAAVDLTFFLSCHACYCHGCFCRAPLCLCSYPLAIAAEARDEGESSLRRLRTYSILYRILYYFILRTLHASRTLHYITLYCIALHCVITQDNYTTCLHHVIASRKYIRNAIARNCTALDYTALHCIALHYIIL